MGAIFHPALTILNAGALNQLTVISNSISMVSPPSVGYVLEALDRERVTVAIGGRHSCTHGAGMAGTGVQRTGQRPARSDPQSKRLLRHQSALYPFTPLYFRRCAHEPGAHRFAGKTIRYLGARNRQYHPPGMHHPPNRLLSHRRTVEKLGIKDLSISELNSYVKEGLPYHLHNYCNNN
jgi:hypothetical protein